MIREARDDDAAGIIALIAGCWAEYPGCLMDLDNEVPELRALATHYAKRGGRVWVAETQGAIVGSVGVAPLADGVWEIGKMYVDAARRGSGVAQALLAGAEDYAIGRGATGMYLGTDTRFTRARRFYVARGYARTGETRELHDISNSVEYGYAKLLLRA